METELRAAAAKDRRILKNSETAQSVIMATMKGDPNGQLPSNYRIAMLRWIEKIRMWYAGHVIRRTVWSIDYTGARISGLEPFKEHFLLIKLYDHEMENLEAVAHDLVEGGNHKSARIVTGNASTVSFLVDQTYCYPPSQAFYLPIRRALLHPSCNPGYEWKNPSSIDEWKQDPSRKLDVLVEVILWHQRRDNQPPLKVVDNQLVPSVDPCLGSGGDDGSTPCDKIVVYCAFPSSYIQLIKVGHLCTPLTPAS